MTSSAYRVYRTIRFEVIVADDEDEIHSQVAAVEKKLEKLALKDLIKKGCTYDLVSDEVDHEYIESWENEEEDEEDEDEDSDS